MSITVEVSKFPKCDLCGKEALYDAKTVEGPWGYLCHSCFTFHGIGLGTGLGQRLILKKREETKPFIPGFTIGDVLRDKEKK